MTVLHKERKLVGDAAPAAAAPATHHDDEGYVNHPAVPATVVAAGADEGYVTGPPAPAAPAPSAPAPSAPYSPPAAVMPAQQPGAAPTACTPGAGDPVACTVPKPSEFNTKLLAVSDPISECLFGVFCCHCAQATAKSNADGSAWLYNCCCWNHGATYSWVRSVYGIKGVCGEDMMASIFCGPCAARRVLTESRIRGSDPAVAGTRAVASASGEPPKWLEPLCGCSSCGFAQACFFPCCQAHEVRLFLHKPTEIDCAYDCCCLMPCAMYGQVRHEYSLPPQYISAAGGVIEDILFPCVMMPCALNQAVREARAHKGQ